MSDPLITSAKEQAKRSLARFGKKATVTWPGTGATVTRPATSETQSVTLVTGKRTSQIVDGKSIVTTAALLSPVKRNPIGATVTVGAAAYKIIASDDLGQAPSDIAAHRVVLA